MNYDQVLNKLATEKFTWLITGCAGFIGTNLTCRLLELNQKVIGIDNFISGQKKNVSFLQTIPEGEFTFIEGDLRNYDTCLQVTTKVDYILHQAALGSIPRSLKTPILSHDCNVNSFINILEASRQNNIKRFVFASSSSVYGDNTNSPKEEPNIGQALAPYPLTKQICELYAQNYQRCFNTQTIGLRYFNVFGKHQNPAGDYAAVIPKWIAKLIANQPIEIYGDGTTSRDFTYIENVIQANLLAALTNNDKAVNQIYNIACQETNSLNSLFDIIQKLLASKLPNYIWQKPLYKDFRSGDTILSFADISKAKELLQYHPSNNLNDGLQKTISWYINNLT